MDLSYRMSKYQTVFNSGTNVSSIGVIRPAKEDPSQPPEPKKSVAGKSVAGGEEVAG